MLSRIGNSLFWMGRYIERAEHLARYSRVQYVSSVDAPLGQNRDFVLESILDMAGSTDAYKALHPALEDNQVINYITVSEENPFSLLSYIGRIRENARGARDSISIELWEAINRFYHKVNGSLTGELPAEEIEFFARRIEENSYITKGYIENTLLHNDVWMLISLGIHLERVIQVIRILQTKLHDIEKLEAAGKQEGALENYQWATTLESTEGFDMYMRCHKTSPTRTHVLDFLLFDTQFPKSVAYSMERVRDCIQGIAFQQEEPKKESIEFMAGKLACRFQYLTIEEVEDRAAPFLKRTLDAVYELAQQLDVKYLKYH
ncbi:MULTISPECIES: alpha-E domain-containing protein [Rufibacter]|uniref:Putative alpha-E superfamily protein n=1 Tax=Rufibacter quisquiliarum TaxID=1549639 RepID=A0A839GE54_9BACT|nr:MULTISPECIES: alpha-E domain-containing protein [Rufibacter]MBA9077202.1 putative alpha-E superfamily protein [Rufibacter quisquiliarum]